ncbi:MAG: serine/threonine protein kinase [Ardenticatenaceae bacterium]
MILLSPNTLLQNRYLIIRKIGQGGMGAVYEAKDQRLGNRVALKQITATNAQLQRAFEREARILARLRHPALPVVIDYFSESNNQFLVMQYIPGDDLEKLLHQQRGPFAQAQVCKWADQLLDALQYLHSQSPPIIHRDIKPANIKLSPRGEVILLDFGIAKGGTTSTTQLTMSGTSIQSFTLTYAPLEQIEGKGTDERSDLYSLGITLYHLLTHVVPSSAISRASAQIYKTPDPLRPANQLNSQVSGALSDVLVEATALNRTQRPASAKVMREALQRAMQAPTPIVRPLAPATQKLPSSPSPASAKKKAPPRPSPVPVTPRNKKVDQPFVQEVPLSPPVTPRNKKIDKPFVQEAPLSPPLVKKKKKKKKKKAPPAPATISSPPRDGELDKLFDEGLEAYQKEEWGGAKDKFAEVVKKQPDYEQDGRRASDLLAEVEQKIANLTKTDIATSSIDSIFFGIISVFLSPLIWIPMAIITFIFFHFIGWSFLEFMNDPIYGVFFHPLGFAGLIMALMSIFRLDDRGVRSKVFLRVFGVVIGATSSSISWLIFENMSGQTGQMIYWAYWAIAGAIWGLFWGVVYGE